ncbi:leucine-rich repeat protein [bacterium]|nr:leucine-rich repeat protein [bacterium]
MEELETVLNGINIYTVDQSIDSKGEYLQAITEANNVINNNTASLQEIKEAKKELEKAKKAYEEAKKQAEENDKYKDFTRNSEGNVLEKYTGTEKSVTIPQELTTIAENAFNNNDNVEEITIETTDPLTLKTNAFTNCRNLKKIIIKSNKIEREEQAIDVSTESQDKTLSIQVPQ